MVIGTASVLAAALLSAGAPHAAAMPGPAPAPSGFTVSDVHYVVPALTGGGSAITAISFTLHSDRARNVTSWFDVWVGAAPYPCRRVAGEQ